ncbi:MAG: ExbD/TolR family protein [Rhodopirellula sp. JB053]|uniref:ExbD/TolR family protein n=1 Tax=Rhodopirellula sp. JB044 TaxID=3342844 RepID=UPI00370A8071
MSDDLLDVEDADDDAMPPRSKREEEEMDITPMIDITFLLLIFFVVASKMDPTQTGNIPDADNGLAISAKDSAVIFIEPGGGDSPAILKRRDQSEFSKDEEAQANEIIEYVTNELEKSISKNKDQVMLLGDGDVKVSEVTRVQKILGDEFTDMEFTYIAVKEQ